MIFFLKSNIIYNLYFTEPFDPNPHSLYISKGEGGGRIGNEEKIQHNIQYKPVSINGNIS